MKSLSEIRQQYLNQLSLQYSPQEIDTIFFSLAENYLHKDKTLLKLGLHELRDENDLKYILFQSALFQLLEGVPYQYILGNTVFYGCTIRVNKSVLIPRPETEELVDWVLKDIINKNQSLRIIDLCSGSGCISIALAKNLPESEVEGIEINEKAIELSLKNSELNEVKVNFIQADLLSTKKNISNKKYDILISNPPYIKESEKESMEKIVLDYEPAEALFVPDNNPLIFYEKIIDFALLNLSKSGKVYVEINQELGIQTQDLFLEYFTSVELKQDLSGNYRMIKADGIIIK